MKKILCILGAVAMVFAFAGIAGATLSNTSHSLAPSGGDCASCHVPHGAAGANRLWPATPGAPGGVTLVGEVAPLCGYCHFGVTGGGGFASADATTFVWGDNSHGVQMSDTSLPGSQIDQNAFPYYDNATDSHIECTTCHDVHSDPAGGVGNGFRPFLRAPIEALCSQCHGNRRYEGGSVAFGNALANWGTDSAQGVNNPGSHPVGPDVTGDNYKAGTSPISIPDEMTVDFPAAGVKDAWAMGGHLTSGDSGGVTCATCHAVHGIFVDTAEATLPATADTVPNGNMLVMFQPSVIQDANGRDIYNGEGGINDLCEACHSDATPSIDAGYNADSYAPNPGGTDFGHPVDDMEIQAVMDWVTAFPADWPVGDLTLIDTSDNVNIADPVVICESCHVPHPAANVNRTDDDGAGGFANSEFILRNSQVDVCADCHTSAAAGHHPVGIAYTGRPVYLPDDGGDLACSTCHSGTGGHNWTGIGAVGLDPDWLPIDNGRAATRAVEQYNADMSITCMDCHYGLDANNGKSPTPYDGIPTESAYATIGSGTHFIGLIGQNAGAFGTTTAFWTNFGGTLNPQGDTWADGGYSRFGNIETAPVLVCESCHELQPNVNVDTHLLLGAFIEEPTSDQGTAFCASCHEPTGTHPLTGDTITRTETNRNLSTDPALGDGWLVDPAGDPNLILSAIGDNFFTCDTCHQIHDANSNSQTFILDTAPANVATNTALTLPTSGSYIASYVTGYQTSPGGDHSSFCDQCHPYK